MTSKPEAWARTPTLIRLHVNGELILPLQILPSVSGVGVLLDKAIPNGVGPRGLPYRGPVGWASVELAFLGLTPY